MPPRWLLLAAALTAAAATARAAVTVISEAPSDDVRLRRATLEARRYLYELSGELPALSGPTELWTPSSTPRVLIANADRLAHIRPSLADAAGSPPPPTEAGSHFVQLVHLRGAAASATAQPVIVCSGVDSAATLFAVYTMLEALGVRFRNHGDIIPRTNYGKVAICIKIDEFCIKK